MRLWTFSLLFGVSSIGKGTNNKLPKRRRKKIKLILLSYDSSLGDDDSELFLILYVVKQTFILYNTLS